MAAGLSEPLGVANTCLEGGASMRVTGDGASTMIPHRST
jgi:hypothetical protein